MILLFFSKFDGVLSFWQIVTDVHVQDCNLSNLYKVCDFQPMSMKNSITM